MYMPPAFREQDPGALHEIIRRNPLGTLVTVSTGLCANHVPFLLDAEAGAQGLGRLRAHVARANREVIGATGATLVVFADVEHYVTPSWYETKRATGRVVPTWNYVAVHVSGRLRLVDDAVWLRRQIDDLTAAHEAALPVPWNVADAPGDFVEAQMRGIVGIEIDIERLEGKWKLSQNRSAADYRGVREGLAAEGSAAALAMARRMVRDDSGAGA